MNTKRNISIFFLCSIFLISFVNLYPQYQYISESNTVNTIEIKEDFIQKELVENLKAAEDDGGYTMNADDVDFSWIEINSPANRMDYISDEDDDYQELNILSDHGWNFTFYNTNYSKVYVSTNGWVSLTNKGDTWDSIDDIPDIDAENDDCIAILAEDFNLDEENDGGGEVFSQFFGNAPNRFLVIEYYQVYEYWSEELIGDFELILCENGTIKFQYKDVYDSGEFYPIIGLDHGDFLNFNNYDDFDLPLHNFAIKFIPSKLNTTSYSIAFPDNYELAWMVTHLNDTAMEFYFGQDWEAQFGYFSDMERFEKTKINITSISTNLTHWKINYEMWNWTNPDNSFEASSDGDFSLAYYLNPLNYSTPHNLTNLIPLLLPNITAYYLANANLSDFYEDMYYDDDPITTELEIYIYPENFHYINIDVSYNYLGILEQLEVSHGKWSEEEIKTEVLFELIHFYDGPTPDYIGVKPGENYTYGVFRSTKNAPPYMDTSYFQYLPSLYEYIIQFIGGEDPITNRTTIIFNLSYYPSERFFSSYESTYIFNITAYPHRSSFPKILNFFPNNTDWNDMNKIFSPVPEGSSIKILDNGFEINITENGNIELWRLEYNSNGALNYSARYYNGKEWYSERLNVFDYQIDEGIIPPQDDDDDDDDDDEGEMIPFGHYYLLFIAIGIIGLVFYTKRKKN